MTFPNGTTISIDAFLSIWSGDAQNVLTSQLSTALFELQKQMEYFEKWKSAKKEAEHYADLKGRILKIDDELTGLDPLSDANKIGSLNGEKRGISSSMGPAKKSAQANLDVIKPYYTQFKKVNYQFVDNYSAFIEDLDQIPLSSYDKGIYGSFSEEQNVETTFTPSSTEDTDSYVWSIRGNEEIDPEIAMSLAKGTDASDGTIVASYSTVPFHDELNTSVSGGGYESLFTKYENVYPEIGKYARKSTEAHSELVPEWFKNKGASIDGKHYVDSGVASPLSKGDMPSVSSGDALIIKKGNGKNRTSLVLNNSSEDGVILVAEANEASNVVSLKKMRYEDLENSYLVRHMEKVCNEGT